MWRLKLQPFFGLHLEVCRQQKRNNKAQWCINALSKFINNKIEI